MAEQHLSWKTILWLSALLVGSSATADAQGVKDVVRDLYGGKGILLAPTPPPFPSHAPHFAADSQTALNNLSTALTSNIGVFAFNSTSSGFTFDPERGVPVLTEEGLGPLLAERATTLGRGKVNIGFSYSRIDFSRFNGTPLNNLSLTLHHDDVNHDGILGPINSPFSFELDQIRIDLKLDISQDLFAFYGTYGVTQDLDVGVIVPIIHSAARAAAHASIVRISPVSSLVHNFDPSRPPDSVVDREATGFGDLIFRSKYSFLRDSGDWPDAAVVGQVKLPTGDEDNLLGTGDTSVLGLLVLSKRYDLVTPHVNVGYEQSTESQLSNVRYVVGADVAVPNDATVSLEVLGRWAPNLASRSNSIIDVALGAKWNVNGRFFWDIGVQVPLNRDAGLRPNIIWTLGGYIAF